MRKGFFHKLREDLRCYDKANTDEDKVLRAHYISAYRGVTVLRTGLSRSGAFGIIFLKRGAATIAARDELRHEFGHILQRRAIGFFAYLFSVFLPSARSDAVSPRYYESDWEITADILGGVQSRAHAQEAADRAFRYLESQGRGRRRKR